MSFLICFCVLYLLHTTKQNNVMKTNFYTLNSSDSLDFDLLKQYAINLLNTKNKVLGIYILTGIYTGLRYSDLSQLKYSDLQNESVIITETKTSKQREIRISKELQEILKPHNNNGLMFLSNKKSIYTIQQLNRLLKDHLKQLFPSKNISTHSLRKTFGNRVYLKSGKSPHSITLLCQVFNHSSEAITKRYLGITKEEVLNVYDIL
jgi:integrase